MQRCGGSLCVGAALFTGHRDLRLSCFWLALGWRVGLWHRLSLLQARFLCASVSFSSAFTLSRSQRRKLLSWGGTLPQRRLARNTMPSAHASASAFAILVYALHSDSALLRGAYIQKDHEKGQACAVNRSNSGIECTPLDGTEGGRVQVQVVPKTQLSHLSPLATFGTTLYVNQISPQLDRRPVTQKDFECNETGESEKG